MAWGHTRVTLREEVARFFGLHTDVATGLTPTTATLDDTKLARFANDYWINSSLYIKTDAGGAAAAPEGESSFVTDFVASTGTLTFSPVMTVAPAVGDTYQLYRHVTKADIDTALKRVCAGGEVATSLTPSTTTLDYDLTCAPGLWRRQQIVGVYRRELADTTTLPYRIVGWQLEDAEGQLMLRLPYLLNSTDALWIVYRTGEDYMPAADTDRVNLPLALMRARAVVYLIENQLTGMAGADLDLWGQKLRYMKELLQQEERAYQPPAGRVHMHQWSRDIADRLSRSDAALGLRSHYGGDFSNWP